MGLAIPVVHVVDVALVLLHHGVVGFQLVEIEIRDDTGHFDHNFFVDVEARHLHVDPKQFFHRPIIGFRPKISQLISSKITSVIETSWGVGVSKRLRQRNETGGYRLAHCKPLKPLPVFRRCKTFLNGLYLAELKSRGRGPISG